MHLQLRTTSHLAKGNKLGFSKLRFSFHFNLVTITAIANCLCFFHCLFCVICCSLDLSTLLQKPVDREEVGGLKAMGSSQGLGHSLVFTNSHHQPARNGGTSAGSNSYTHATLVRPPIGLIYSI